ncbi:hypothetical protein DOY81_005476 [Sarcophaga bullata]|nr:hypothetical protein DOY81_005476 [Sarcophaga bullata]
MTRQQQQHQQQHCLSHCPPYWSSVSESHTTEAQEAAHFVYTHTGGRIGEKISQTKIFAERAALARGLKMTDAQVKTCKIAERNGVYLKL